MGLGDIGAPIYNVGGGQDTQVFNGTISAQNAAPTGTASLLSTVAINANGKATVSFQVSANTLNVPLALYGTVDGSNWVAIGGNPMLNQAINLWVAGIVGGTNGIFTAASGDFSSMRLSTPNGTTTGSAAVAAVAGSSAAIVSSEPMRINTTRVVASTLVKSIAGLIHTLSISGLTATPTAGLLTIYDSTTATGTVLYSEWVTASVLPHSITLDGAFLTGLYIGFDGTLANVAITATTL